MAKDGDEAKPRVKQKMLKISQTKQEMGREKGK